MKILNLSDYSWENGGPAQTIFNHTEQQLAQGNEVDILTPYDATTNFYTVPHGAKLIKCKKNGISKVFHHFSFETWQFLRKNKNNYDVIHLHGIWNFPSLYVLLTKTKALKLVTIHGMAGSYTLNKSKLFKKVYSFLFQKKALRNADLVHVLHEGELDELDNYLGYRHPNAFILPNGIQEKYYQQLPDKQLFIDKFSIKNNKKIILFLGRIDAKKGIDLLLPAFLEVSKIDSEATLVLVGPDYGMKNFTEKFIEENNLQERVILTGILKGKEKLEAFSAAQLFVLPSYSEGFSIAVMEALTCGLPVVVSPFTGFSEVIAAHEAGKIVQLSSEKIAEGILFYLTNEVACQHASLQAKRLIHTNYSIEKVANNLLEIVKNKRLKM
jgi:glycosyltransferase involved in cell wall biosynthesis